jgi:hypothetical protein
MTLLECRREQDILDALASRRWPDRCDRELREHVAACAFCADLVTVAAALLDGEESGSASGEVPPASLVWWRAQLRAREEAARAAVRPIRIVQRVALGCAGVLSIVALASLLPLLASSAASGAARVMSAIPSIDRASARDVALASLAGRGVQLGAAASLVLGPVVIYLAFSRE